MSLNAGRTAGTVIVSKTQCVPNIRQ